MHLFGRAKPKSTPKDAIATLRDALEMLDKREKHLEVRYNNETKMAQQNAKNKTVALMALKRRKQISNEMAKVSASKMSLEAQMMTLENANLNLETLKAMKTGSEALKNIHGAMDINKVDATMDEIRDQMDIANEISEAIAQPLGNVLDEDELLEELEELEAEALHQEMTEKPTTVPNLPKPVKVGQSSSEEKLEDEDAELELLRASMT